MFALQRGCAVLHEPVLFKRVQEELGVEWNVGQVVGVLDTAYQVLSVAAKATRAAATSPPGLTAALPFASDRGGHSIRHTHLEWIV